MSKDVGYSPLLPIYLSSKTHQSYLHIVKQTIVETNHHMNFKHKKYLRETDNKLVVCSVGSKFTFN